MAHLKLTKLVLAVVLAAALVLRTQAVEMKSVEGEALEEGIALEKRFGEVTGAARKLLVTISTGTSTTVVNGQANTVTCVSDASGTVTCTENGAPVPVPPGASAACAGGGTGGTVCVGA